MKKRLTALCCVLALIGASCGSRLSDQELSTGSGGGGGGGGAASAVDGPGISSGGGGGGDEGEDKGDGGEDAGPKVGTLPVPCGPAEGGAPEAPAGDVPGVSADTIKIAVISDRAGVVKFPTISIEESMKAFVGFCNDFGGINGRKLELTTIDSELFKHLEATREACNAGVFAVVGSGSVTDNAGAQALLDCGLIEVAGYTVTAAKSLSDNVYAPIPNPTDAINMGPARYVKKKYPDAVKKAAIIHSGIEAIDVQADRIVTSYTEEGYDFVYNKTTEALQPTYTSEVKAMQDAGVEYVTMVSATSEVQKLLRDMKTQGFEPEVVDLGQQYYDPDLLEEPGAEGAIVQLNTIPFEEADDSPALQAYLAAYDKVGGDTPEPSSLGVQAYSAGLLFATAAKAAGPDLTRDKVVEELKKIKEWDGGGLHYPTDPGDRKVNTCFMYDVVKGGKFVRLYPEKATEFDCSDDYAYELGKDYGGGAKAP